MVDVTSEEYKTEARNGVFKSSMVKSGIVRIVDYPLEPALKCTRYQTWTYEQTTRLYGEGGVGNRVGYYLSRQLTNLFMSIFQGVAGADPLPEWAEMSKYRLAQAELFRTVAEQNDHPIALIPSAIFTYLNNQSLLSYHICPFTKDRIYTYGDKRLVIDDGCPQPYLLYPGTVKLFCPIPESEIRLYPETPDTFSHYWKHHISVNGFEFVYPGNPSNNYIANSMYWKKTGISRIVRVS